jgi:hypothetical protein
MAPLIRDRHRLERSTQVGFTRLAHVQAPISGKPEIGVCSAPLRAALRPGHLLRMRQGAVPARHVSGLDGACAKSGLRSRLMMLALRILYFEDLSVGMTDFTNMHDGA